jgi:outer membrane receptor protein involved in Fe transport
MGAPADPAGDRRPDERTRVGVLRPGSPHTLAARSRCAQARLPALGPTPGVSIHGNPEFRSERVDTFELGWRRRLGNQLGLDATVFHSRYDRLRTLRNWVTFAPFTANVQFTNAMEGSTSGAELSALWTVSPRWRLVGNLTCRAAMHDLDIGQTRLAGRKGRLRTQAGVSSYVDLGQGWSFDTPGFGRGRPNNDPQPNARVTATSTPPCALAGRSTARAGARRGATSPRRVGSNFISELGAGVTLHQRVCT